MIHSMTGFGEASASRNGWIVSTRLKTLNHKFLDISVKGLEEHEELELRARDILKSSFARGRIELKVEIEKEGASDLTYDFKKALSYYKCLSELIHKLKLDDHVSLGHLIALEGVIKRKEGAQNALWPPLERSLQKSVKKVQEARRREGLGLERELKKHLKGLQVLLTKIQARAPQMKQHFKEQLRRRAAELLGAIHINEAQLEQEAVLFAERSDITEEIARLKIHLQAALESTRSKEPAGRILDFLAQEMAREINTIASKARDSFIAGLAVEMKAQVEKLREQVRNVE